jgi:hypothetical protein
VTRPPNPEPGSEECFSKARRWLKECLTEHVICPKPSGFVPQRLIELNSDISMPTAKIVITDSPSYSYEPYASLSYSWGVDKQPLILTKHTLQSFLEEIPYSQLPQTIKDALRCVQEIGLKYLWVDVLCIVQDDAEDKRQQIACMADIYEQAQVTIAAARAQTVHEGFLHLRSIAGNLLERGFQLPFRCTNGQLGSVILVNLPSPGIGWYEPIDERAWTLEESLLSVRMLEYGTHQLRWRCRTIASGPEYVDGWTAGKVRSYPVIVDWGVFQRRPLYGNTLGDFVHTWKLLVTEYSGRNLNKPHDKLLALSAVARRFSQLTGHEYVAGLWRHALGKLLLWHPYHDLEGISAGRYALEYRSPSWSWASVDGRILFNASSDDRIEAVGIELETIPRGDPFGAVIFASLRIRARVCSITIDENLNLLDPISNESIPGRVAFDVSQTLPLEVLLLEVSSLSNSGQQLPIGLILCDGEVTRGGYRRLGIFELKPSETQQRRFRLGSRGPDIQNRHIFDRCEDRIVTII